MKKLLVVLLATFCATVMVQAQDTNSAPSSAAAAPATGKKKHLTPEQQQLMDEMLAKYDTNKDGKLDKTERAAMTPEDKQKMIDAGLMKSKKPKTEDSTTSTPSTNAPAGNN